MAQLVIEMMKNVWQWKSLRFNIVAVIAATAAAQPCLIAYGCQYLSHRLDVIQAATAFADYRKKKKKKPKWNKTKQKTRTRYSIWY